MLRSCQVNQGELCHADLRTDRQTDKYVCMYICTHLRTHTHTHTHTRARMHARTHTHTHTHSNTCVWIPAVRGLWWTYVDLHESMRRWCWPLLVTEYFASSNPSTGEKLLSTLSLRPNIERLCYVPLFLLMICYIVSVEGDSPERVPLLQWSVWSQHPRHLEYAIYWTPSTKCWSPALVRVPQFLNSVL